MLLEEKTLKIANEELRMKLAQNESAGNIDHNLRAEDYRDYLSKTIANHEYTLKQYQDLYASLNPHHPALK